MKLTQAQWITLSERLNEGLDVPVEARAAWLETLAGFDPRLKSVLSDLLRKHSLGDTGDLPNSLPPIPDAVEANGDSRLERPAPVAIGRYRVLSLLGEGGMGTVYQAEQDRPRRTVAIKIVKPGLTSPEVLRRFEHESQSLARLQHPGIAQIFEAGIADSGYGEQPWFAMEFIRGLSLLEFAKAQLNTSQRLEVLIKTCDAVHHAHMRGIVHRDLKPANILVDESGQPKIVDFGVAHITEGDVHSTRETHFGDLVGTLAYMSPEQVLADPMELDARTDVYTLGVVLYELLAGSLPYRVSGSLPHAMHVIRETNPAPLASLNRSFRGDLETIVNKAMAKDKTQRYGSAADLAADLRRYLTNDPILARPPSASYQIRKFAVRYQGLTLAVLSVFAALVAGLLATGWQTVRANRERDRAVAAERNATQNRDRALLSEQVADGERIRARQERNRALAEARRADTQSASAKAVSDFLQNDLLALAGPSTQSGPNTKFDPDLKVRALLDRAAARIAGKFDFEPLVEAAIRQTLSSAYIELGLFAEAQPQTERAFELRQRVLGPEHPETVRSMGALGGLYQRMGKYVQAEPLLSKTLDVRRRLRGDRDKETLAAMGELATLAGRMQGDYARVEALFTRVLEVQLNALGEEHPDTLAIMNNLAVQYVNQGKYHQAEDLQNRLLKVKRRVMGEEHPSTLLSMSNLGVVKRYQGKYAQAETLLAQSLQSTRRVLGEEHHETLKVRRSLALLFLAQARYADAETLLNEVLKTGRKVSGGEHPDTLAVMNNLAELHVRQNRYTEAESMFNEILAIRRRKLAANHPNISNVLASLGGIMLERGKYTEAEPLLREALDGQRKTGPDTWRRYYTESLLGSCLTGLGRYEEAEQLLISGDKGVLARQDSMPFENRQVINQTRDLIARLYRQWGRSDAPPVSAPLSKR